MTLIAVRSSGATGQRSNAIRYRVHPQLALHALCSILATFVRGSPLAHMPTRLRLASTVRRPSAAASPRPPRPPPPPPKNDRRSPWPRPRPAHWARSSACIVIGSAANTAGSISLGATTAKSERVGCDGARARFCVGVGVGVTRVVCEAPLPRAPLPVDACLPLATSIAPMPACLAGERLF